MQPFGPNARVINIAAGPAALIEKDAIAAHLASSRRTSSPSRQREGAAYDLVHSHYWMSGWVGDASGRSAGACAHVAMFHTLGEVKNRARITEHETRAAHRCRARGRDARRRASSSRASTRRTC